MERATCCSCLTVVVLLGACGGTIAASDDTAASRTNDAATGSGTSGTGTTGTGTTDSGTTGSGSLRCGAWVDQTHGSAAAEQLYASITSDASGEHLVATSGLTIPSSYTEGVWASTNGGVTWNVQTADPAAEVDMTSLASSSDGSVIVGCGAATGGLCTSTNGGVTWDCSSSTSRLDGWVGVASSSTGTALVAVNAFGDIWTSSNSGATWIDRIASGSCPCQQGIAVASDASGANLVELGGIHVGGGGPAFHGDIWTSNDSGVTWTDRTPSGPAHDVPWAAVASNATGDKLIAVGSRVWLSTDSGATWTDRTPSGVNPSGSWRAVASDATGTHLILANGFPSWTGDLWTSTDSGVTWTNETAGTCAANQAWSGVASDATGSHLVAVASGGDIWTRVSQAQ